MRFFCWVNIFLLKLRVRFFTEFKPELKKHERVLQFNPFLNLELKSRHSPVDEL